MEDMWKALLYIKRFKDMRKGQLESGERVPVLLRDQILTVGDLENFRQTLLNDLENLLKVKPDNGVKQWLRASEVRKMLGVSPGTLQNLRISRKLSFSKIGGIVFYKHEDIIRLLEDNCVLKAEKHG